MSTSLINTAMLITPLSYETKLPLRDMTQVDTVVIHCTELPTMALAREFGERIHYQSGTGNSGHFYLDKAGKVYRYVSEDRVAHHVANHNDHTIGIEIINNGRYPDWYKSQHQQLSDPYPEQQITALITLLGDLQRRYPTLKHIAGHEDLDTRMMVAEDDESQQIQRKIDPGPLFPWSEVLAKVSLKRVFE